MPERSPSYSQSCLMNPPDIEKISQMIASHPQFSSITITSNGQNTNSEVLVTFNIPYSLKNMAEFYHEFYQAISSASPNK